MSAVRAVLFDLDDTLFDHAHGVVRAVEQLREEHACLQTKPLDEILAEYGRLLELMHPDVLVGRLKPDQSRIARMRGLFAFCGAEVSEEFAAASAALHRERYRTAQQAVPGARELLLELRGRGLKIGIVTNNFLEEQRGKLAVCGLNHLVEALVTSEETGCIKPDAGIFRIALDLVGCGPDEAMMVGDSWDVDIVGARNAGIRPVWFNRSGRPQPPGERVQEIASLEPAVSVARAIVGERRS